MDKRAHTSLVAVFCGSLISAHCGRIRYDQIRDATTDPIQSPLDTPNMDHVERLLDVPNTDPDLLPLDVPSDVPMWSRRHALIFNNADSSEDLLDFPVLVVLNNARIALGMTQPNGADLRFRDS